MARDFLTYGEVEEIHGIDVRPKTELLLIDGGYYKRDPQARGWRKIGEDDGPEES